MQVQIADDTTEEAKFLAQMCSDRAEAKARGEKLMPIHLDSDTPITIEYKNNRPVYKQITTVVREEPKIGRNDPCHCGSGKKFKKCCINA